MEREEATHRIVTEEELQTEPGYGAFDTKAVNKCSQCGADIGITYAVIEGACRCMKCVYYACPHCAEKDAEDRSNTLSAYFRSAREDFAERLRYQENNEDRQALLNDPTDELHEIADSSVPCYTVTLCRLVANHPDLACTEPENGPAYDGEPTPVNIIAAVVYEAIEADLWEYVEELKQDYDDEAAEDTDA